MCMFVPVWAGEPKRVASYVSGRRNPSHPSKAGRELLFFSLKCFDSQGKSGYPIARKKKCSKFSASQISPFLISLLTEILTRFITVGNCNSPHHSFDTASVNADSDLYVAYR